MFRCLVGSLLLAATSPPVRAADAFAEHILPLLQRHCYACHAGEAPEGELRLDQLPPDFTAPTHEQSWLQALAKLTAGEMPPPGKPRPTAQEARTLTRWIEQQAAAAQAQRRQATGRAVLRRLSRVEYEHTLRDLLAIRADLKELLPIDGASHGFDNVGQALHVSPFLLERYLQAADMVLNLAIANAPQPPLTNKRYLLADERQVKGATERVYLSRNGATVMFSSSPWSSVTLGQFYPPHRGLYRFRISAYGVQSGDRPVAYRIDAGPMLMGTTSRLVDYFDAPADRPTVIEFVEHFEAREHIRISPYGIGTAFDVTRAGGAANYAGPGLAIEWIDVEGPLHDEWPPASHRRIFGDLPQQRVGNRLEVVSPEPADDARRIVRGFAERAFRRPVSDDDVQPFFELVDERLAANASFEQAVRVGLKGVLVSPDFLFLRETPGPLDDFALASRLSYFLWSTMPDEPLLAAARKGELTSPDTLRSQVERLFDDPRAAVLVRNFTDQWLDLKDIAFTAPDRRLYPEFDDLLQVSMVEETRRFFAAVLADDLSLTNFVASDFSVLNARLAEHYGLEPVAGWEFRRVQLPPTSRRGGLLTMASILKVTANGTTTSPVVRGAWVLDRILGQPPAPPPPGVSAIEPDIRGAVTIREQLARHRETPSCQVCHARIDPPGFALENFDVIGGWRDHYRTVGRGQPVTIDGRRMPYLQGPPVESGDVLPDGRRFADIDEYKQLLLAEPDQLARALTGKLLTYATGHPPEAADHDELEQIVARVRARGYGLRTLLHELVASPLFQHK